MDKLIATLLSTNWGKSLIGWTMLAFFSLAIAIGVAYLDLLKDYKNDMRAGKAREAQIWEDRVNDLKYFHQRQDDLQSQIMQKQQRTPKK